MIKYEVTSGVSLIGIEAPRYDTASGMYFVKFDTSSLHAYYIEIKASAKY